MKQLNGIKGNSCLLKEEALKCKISFGLSDTICKQTATKHLKRLRNYCYIVSTIRNQFGNETKSSCKTIYQNTISSLSFLLNIISILKNSNQKGIVTWLPCLLELLSKLTLLSFVIKVLVITVNIRKVLSS